MENMDKMIVCPICLRMICPCTQAPVAMDPCGHVFHKECAETHLLTNHNCPMCRTICNDNGMAELKFPETTQLGSGLCALSEFQRISNKLVELDAEKKNALSAYHRSLERYEKFLSDLFQHLKELESIEEIKHERKVISNNEDNLQNLVNKLKVFLEVQEKEKDRIV